MGPAPVLVELTSSGKPDTHQTITQSLINFSCEKCRLGTWNESLCECGLRAAEGCVLQGVTDLCQVTREGVPGRGDI